MENEPSSESLWSAPLRRYEVTIQSIIGSGDAIVSEKRDEHLRFAYMDLLEALGVEYQQIHPAINRLLLTYRNQYTFGDQVIDLRLAPLKLLATEAIPLERLYPDLLAAMFDSALKKMPSQHTACTEDRRPSETGDVSVGCSEGILCPKIAVKQLSLRLVQLLSIQHVFSRDDPEGGRRAIENQDTLGRLLDEYDVMSSVEYEIYTDKCDEASKNAFVSIFMDESGSNGEVSG